VESPWLTSRTGLQPTERNCIVETCDFALLAGQRPATGIAGGQGVAGSNPVVPTAQRAVLLRRGGPPSVLSTCGNASCS
jgi:hypothetical protein